MGAEASESVVGFSCGRNGTCTTAEQRREILNPLLSLIEGTHLRVNCTIDQQV